MTREELETETQRGGSGVSGVSFESLNIAVTHEHYIERGGGEHVADHLARTFDAPVYAGLAREGATAEDVNVRPVCDGLWGRIMEHVIALRDLTYWQAWRYRPGLTDYDVVIQSGNNPGWYVPSNHEQVIIKYVHSPQRTPYDRWHESKPGVFRRVYGEAARQLYLETTTNPDLFVANSEVIARRIEQHWGIDRDRIEVVYPPTDTASFGPEHASDTGGRQDRDGQDGYYFTFSRLYESKRIGEIVQAFDRLGDDYQLVVGGDGPDRDRLESLAGDNVAFVGYLSEREKRRHLAAADALVFNAYQEDFGMIPVEAFASGTPVIGVREGFTAHQVLDGQNGHGYDRGVEALADAIQRFETAGVAWSPADIQQFAEQFSVDRFRERMRALVAATYDRTRVDPDLDVPSLDGADAEKRPVATGDGGDSHDEQ